MKKPLFTASLCTLFALIGVLFYFNKRQSEPAHPPLLEVTQAFTDQVQTRPVGKSKSGLKKQPATKSLQQHQTDVHVELRGRLAVMPAQNSVDNLIERAEKEAPEGVYRFAAPIDVSLTPENSGEWNVSGDTATWTLEVQSESAESLNFGFTSYKMPKGGELRLSTGFESDESNSLRAFTSDDNEEHGQLWTPILSGNSATITVTLPANNRDELELVLSRVNHGFRGINAIKTGDLEKIGDSTSSDCQIDTACDSATLPSAGAVIEAYDSQIRSAGAFTLYGIDACSGVMLNNLRNDNTPYFLTAAHCGINPANAASVVVYWNFENTTCRAIGSTENGNAGDGSISDFSTGSTFCASSRLSDFCLIRLDDEIDPNFNVFYAGWDRSTANPEASVGIHHPGVAEKRISIDEDPTTTTPRFSDQIKEDGAYIRIGNWEHGSTEGGSSGSPLFNSNGHVVGQLLGGYSQCGKSRPDWYGRISASWDGEGTYWTRLSDWLDPDGTGATTLEGIEQENSLTIEDLTITESDLGTNADFTVFLNRKTSDSVTVDWQATHLTTGNDDLAEATGSLIFSAGETSATISIPINGDTDEEGDEYFLVELINPTSAVLTYPLAVGKIANDDFVTAPVISSPLSVSVAEGETLHYQIGASHTPQSYNVTGAPAEVSVDAAGLITWVEPASGNYTFQIEATSPAGTGTANLSVEVIQNTLGEGLDNATFTYSNTGDANWSLTTQTSNDGEDSVVSALVGNNESSGFSFTVAGPDHLVFNWKISSEYNADTLSVLVNGQYVDWIHGERDWTENAIELPGASNTVEFIYEKDFSEFGGFDRAFVDNIKLASNLGRPVMTSLRTISGVEGAPLGFAVAADKAVDQITVTGLPPGLIFDSADGFVYGSPTAHGIFDVDVILENASGSSHATIELEVARGLPALSEELGEHLYWGTSNSFDWQLATFGVQSGDIDDGENSAIKTIVDGPATLSFLWKVDSEEHADFLSVYVNGTLVDFISGQTGWESKSIPLSGESLNSVEFVYSKDGSISTGEDTGWVNNLNVDGVPQKLKFTATQGTSSSSVMLDWDYDSSMDDVWIYRAESSDPADATYIGRATSLYLDFDTVDSQLYFYWAIVENEHGTSLISDPVQGWTSSSLPGVPANFSATDFTSIDGVDLSWSAVSTAHAYRVSRSTSTSGPWETITEADHSSLEFSDTSAVAGIQYYYRVEAENAMGHGSPTAPDAGARKLDAPASLQLLSESFNGVTLQWAAPEGQFDSFSILQSLTPDPASATVIATLPSSTLQYLDADSVPGQTYYYFVRAESSQGSSLVSSSVSGSASIVRVVGGGLWTESGSEYLSIEFIRPKIDSPNFDFQISSDLETWSTVDAVDLEQVGTAQSYDADHETVRFRLKQEVTTESAQFMKLLISTQ